jgi:hypothetical protein
MFASTVRFWGRSRDLPGRIQPHIVPGGYSEGETPGPIPNPEVKPLSADGTAREASRESRTPPEHHYRRPAPSGGGPSRVHPGDTCRGSRAAPASPAGFGYPIWYRDVPINFAAEYVLTM